MRSKTDNSLSTSSSPTISPLVMKQQDWPKTMQQTSEIDQISKSILQVILDSSNFSNILLALAGRVGELFAVDTCIVVSTKANSSNANEISYWQEKPDSELIQKQIIQKLSNLPLKIDDARQSHIISGVASPNANSLEYSLQKILPTKTWLGVATKYQHQTNGLVLLFKSTASGWTNSEQELLAKIAESMAISLAQIQLQQQVATKTQYQALLNKLSQGISQNSNPQLLFDNCLAEICKTLQVDRGMVLMLKYQHPLRAQGHRQQFVQGTVQVVSKWSPQTESLPSPDQLSFSFDDSNLCQQAWQIAPQCSKFESNVVFPDLSPQQLPDAIQKTGSALLMMPLIGKKNSKSQPGIVLGFLVLQQNSARPWLEEEVNLVDWVSVQISTAVIHHQTLTQVQSIVEERTAQLKWSLDVQGKLSAKMRQHIEQLEKLNQLKDDFMNSMSHELKTPLTSMKMAIKMLRQAQLPSEMQTKYLNILEQEWEREYSLIKDLLTLQQVESGELIYRPQELDLGQIINKLAQSFTVQWQSDIGVQIKTSISDSNLKIDTDAESLEHIINELLLNACKYSERNTVIQLTAESHQTTKGKDIVIAISNYGAGITSEELPYIFDKFRRGKGVTDHAVPGTGLGLTLVKYLVEHLNGKIDVTSEPIEDDSLLFLTTFVVQLPQFQPSIPLGC